MILNWKEFWSPFVEFINSHLLDSVKDLLAEKVFTLLPWIL